MNQYVNILKKKLYDSSTWKGKKKYDLYESNIEAFIRFIHIQNINPVDGFKWRRRNTRFVNL